MLCLWIPRSHLFLLAATLIPSRGALVMPCCMPLQFLYAGQEHEEMCRTAGPSHGGSTGKGVFHISVGSKPLRLNVWKMVPCTWANQISWIIVQHSLCLATVCIIFNFLQVIIWWISHAHQAVICPPSLREPQRLCISRGKKNQKCVSQSTWNKFISFEHISCSLLSPVAFCGESVHPVCRNHKPEIKKEDVFAVRSHSNEIFIHWFLMCGFVRRKARFVCIYILRVMWWHSHPEGFFFSQTICFLLKFCEVW